ncbi:MAG: hybrid sensory histidine kinase BarA [Methanoregulaceae archaeon PtaB.Bin056]|jgi:CheY-like chemotaxis protein|nr:MAG: hybrid sensory histidine kinase BarA [Methanoregulaceae archaeon PtaB.Bin056]
MMKRKILYIEDNDQNFYLVSYILGVQGHQVIRARDGREGIDLATTERPDLILLDIQLPVMDGYATARELRRIPGVASTPIVALTSYAMAGDREKALESGCTGYIEKPINPRTFTEQIGQYLPSGNTAGGGG